MPIYVYRCDRCGESFDFLAKTLSAKPESCPVCNGTDLRKQLTAFSAAVKGSPGTCPSADTCGHAHGPGCCCCH